MLKFLLILVIAIYLLSKIGRLIFGARMSSSQNRSFNSSSNDNVNSKGKTANNKSTIKGGEYIDYEEVK